MDGVEDQLEPPEPVDVDPHSLSASEGQDRGIERLPETLSGALAALEDDDVLLEALGDELATSFIEVKYDEFEQLTAEQSNVGLNDLIRGF